ncbi:MAG: DUF2723 domain-containing protein [Deltaproteobacteria bacterium]|nr:DUF2723 domain-containing protein [Deltaproteobacteria bacterium]
MTYPSIYWGDSGEFSYMATFLGIPHPTGYPLYIQLLRLFSFLPVGSPYFLHNLFSAFLAVLAIAILFKICLQITGHQASSWIATFYFALSPNFLARAGLAEVYTLQAFICLLVTLLGLSLIRDWDIRKLWMISFILGLGISHHLTTIMYLPAFLLLLVFSPKGTRNLKLFMGIGLFAFIGILPYLFIALRGHLPSAFSYPNLFGITMSSPTDWFWLISGKIFRVEMTSFSLDHLIKDFGFFFYLLFQDYYWLGGVFGLLGLVKGVKKQARPTLFIGILFLTQTLFFIQYKIPDIHEFYIMSFGLWAPWFAMGLNESGQYFKEFISVNKRLSPFFSRSLYLLIVIPLLGLLYFHKPVPLNEGPLAYVQRVLSYPQENFSLFTTYTGRDIFRLYQSLTGARPDVTIIDYGLNLLKERSRLMDLHKNKDSIFFQRLHLNDTTLMEELLISELKKKPVFFSRYEWFLGDKFFQKKIFESFYSVTLKPPTSPIGKLPDSAIKSDLSFGSSLKLLGFNIEPAPLVEGERFSLSLYWQKIGQVPHPVTALVLLKIKTKENVLTPLDHFFVELTLGYGWDSPESWEAKGIMAETYHLNVPTLYPGEYTISLALFNKKIFNEIPFEKIPKSFSLIGETQIVSNPKLSHYWDKN